MSSSSCERPLSPHLQIYKPQISSVLSILHRLTGVALFVGSFVWALWLYVVGASAESYDCFQSMMLHPIGLVLLFGWTFSLFYHMSNGIRHLMWDAGYGYDVCTMRRTGWMVVISAFVFTAITWALGIVWQGVVL